MGKIQKSISLGILVTGTDKGMGTTYLSFWTKEQRELLFFIIF